MPGHVRVATVDDVPAMQRVRMAVRENRLSSTALGRADYRAAILQTGRGWVLDVEGEIVGFAIGNAVTASLWALFVHPAHEGRGHGRRLHDAAIAWLRQEGLSRVWLVTDANTRAEGFYEALGWQRAGVTESGELRLELGGAPPTSSRAT